MEDLFDSLTENGEPIDLREHEHRLDWLAYLFGKLVENGSASALNYARLCVVSAADLMQSEGVASEEAKKAAFAELNRTFARMAIEAEKREEEAATAAKQSE